MPEITADLRETLDSVQRQMRELREESAAQMRRMADHVRWQSADAARMARRGVQSWPAASVLGAFALGLAIGVIAAQAGTRSRGGNVPSGREDPFGGAEA